MFFGLLFQKVKSYIQYINFFLPKKFVSRSVERNVLGFSGRTRHKPLDSIFIVHNSYISQRITVQVNLKLCLKTFSRLTKLAISRKRLKNLQLIGD